MKIDEKIEKYLMSEEKGEPFHGMMGAHIYGNPEYYAISVWEYDRLCFLVSLGNQTKNIYKVANVFLPTSISEFNKKYNSIEESLKGYDQIRKSDSKYKNSVEIFHMNRKPYTTSDFKLQNLIYKIQNKKITNLEELKDFLKNYKI
jgi:hypothetical protein